MKLLVDTNIFIDIYLNREKYCDFSKKFFYKAFENKDQLYVNASSLKDIYFFSLKFMHDKNKAIKTIYDIYNNVTKVIDCSSDDVINSLFEDGDFEDNVLINSANRMMCDAIITRNIKDFNKKDINCFTPEEYLSYR